MEVHLGFHNQVEQCNPYGISLSLMQIMVLIVGQGGIILRTKNSGITWNTQSSEITEWLSGVSFADSSNGIVVGANGKILKTTSGGVTFIEENEIEEQTPQNYLISQNYPNPFNPVTKIKYTIPQTNSSLPGGARGGLVTLMVYNTLGREVATLVNEEKPAGEYEVEFNAANLPSGIYFYQLNSGEFRETKKMVLLR